MGKESKLIRSSIKLDTLLLQNFATFQDTTISFEKGFNTIIGETGSGKSLVLEAIQLALGHRADKKFIRKGADFTTIEATFSVTSPSALTFLDNIGHPTDTNEVVIKRILYKTGKSKAFINFQQCALTTLQNFARSFVDLVGQFENQKLLDTNYQLELIDNYANCLEILNNYQNNFEHLKTAQQSLEHLKNKKREDYQRKDFLHFQIEEFENLSLDPDEENKLIREKEQLMNREERQQNLLDLQNHLDGEDGYRLLISHRQLIDKLDAFPEFNTFQKSSEEAYQQLTELSYQISLLLNEDNDDTRLTYVIERLDQIQKIKRKYNLDINEIFNLIEDYKRQLTEFDNLELTIKELEQNIEQLTTKLNILANDLHKIRIKAAKKIETQITKVIRELNMRGATLFIKVNALQELNPYGKDKIEITAETNPGEGIYPIRQIASGGELSRVLLAFRQVLSLKDSISIFLFDEIDTGIGGETALKIGKALQEVSQASQVIAITHLPQLATFADQLIDVTKETTADKNIRTVSRVTLIRSSHERETYVQQMVPLSPRH